MSEEETKKPKKAIKPIEQLLADAKPELPPQPPKPRKIAILGSAVSSVGLAPFDDPEWEIWGCSPANRGLKRVDLWFELHNLDIKRREGLTEWLEWLKEQPQVFLQQKDPAFKGSIKYPFREMVDKHGRFWWTSQVAYMLALAIEQKPHTIGIYGVDMAANSEYNQQRLACQYFILLALQRGIQLVVPPESDLLEPPPPYGYCESSRRWRKYNARKLELQDRIGNLHDQEAKAAGEKKHLIGALDDHEYHLAHWANTYDFDFGIEP